MNIDNEGTQPYIVRVETPEGHQIEVDAARTTNPKEVTRIASSIAAWLAVDKWESSSRFVPEGVREVAEDVISCFPDTDLSRCTVLVLQFDPSIKTNHGYSVRMALRVGAVVPNMLRSLREEERSIRKDSGHKSPRPHITQDRITKDMFDEIPFSNSDDGKDDFGF